MSSLIELLNHFLNPDNEVRKQAEAIFGKLLEEQCELTILGLTRTIKDTSLAGHLRQLAAVLLRRNLVESETSAYYNVSESSQQTLLSELSTMVKSEDDEKLRMLITEVVGELGNILERDEWPELPQLTLTLCKSDNTDDRLIGLLLLGYIAEQQLSGPYKQYFLTQSQEILTTNYTQQPYSSNARLLLHNIRALNNILQSIRTSSQLGTYIPLVPTIFQNLFVQLQIYLTNYSNEDNIVHYLESIVEICEHSIDYFSSALDRFLPAILTEVVPSLTSAYLQSNRGLSLLTLFIEFLVTLSANKKVSSYKGPKTDEQTKHYFALHFFPYLCKLFLYLDESQLNNFQQRKTHINFDMNSLHSVAEQSLVQCLHNVAINHTGIYNIIMEIIHSYLSINNAADFPPYRYHIAAFEVLTSYLEISSMMNKEDALALHQQEILQLLSHYLLQLTNLYNSCQIDIIAYMQYVLYCSLSQFIFYHGNRFNSTVCIHVLTSLLTSLLEENKSKLLSHHTYRYVLHCVLNLLEQSKIEIYPVALLDQLVVLLGEAVIKCNHVYMVTEVAYSTLLHLLEIKKSSRINIMQEIWSNRYADLMNILKHKLYSTLTANFKPDTRAEQNYDSTTDVYTLLDLISLLGEEVDVNKFQSDGYEIIQSLQSYYTQKYSTTNEDGDSGGYNMKAILRITKRLGQDSTPYIPSMLDHIVTALSQDNIISSHATNEMENLPLNFDPDDEKNIEIYDSPLDDKRYCLNKKVLQEQLLSLESLHYIMTSEKVQDGNYLAHVLLHFSRLLFLVHRLANHAYEDLRTNSLLLLPSLAQVLCIHVSMNHISTSISTQTSSPYIQVSESKHCKYDVVISLPGGSDAINVQQILLSMLRMLLDHVQIYADQLDYCATMCRILKELIYQSSLDRLRNKGEVEMFAPAYDHDVLNQISHALKNLVRDCLQRRAVHQAERRLHSLEEEDGDENDSIIILTEAISFLYHHITETLAVMIQSHPHSFLQVYNEQWQELLFQFLFPYIIPEDQSLALDILSSLLLYSFPALPIEQTQPVLLTIHEKVCQIAHDHYKNHYLDADGVDPDVVEVDRKVFYVLSLLVEKYSAPISSLSNSAKDIWVNAPLNLHYVYVQTLQSALIETPESFQNSPLGALFDSILYSLGVIVYTCLILQILPMMQNNHIPIETLYVGYMKLWPLRFDQEEAERSIYQFYKLLADHATTFFSMYFTHPSALYQALYALIDTYLASSKILSNHCQGIVYELIRLLSFHYYYSQKPYLYTEKIYLTLQQQHLLHDLQSLQEEIMQKLDPDYFSKLKSILEGQSHLQQANNSASFFLTS